MTSEPLANGLPRWQLESIYPGLDSAPYLADKDRLKAAVDGLERYFDDHGVSGGADAQSSAAQRHAIDPLAAIQQALAVTRQHLEPCQQVMPEGHWLGSLQVGKARHDDRRMLLCLIKQAGLQSRQLSENLE